MEDWPTSLLAASCWARLCSRFCWGHKEVKFKSQLQQECQTGFYTGIAHKGLICNVQFTHPVKLNLNGRLLTSRLRWPCFTGPIKINKIFIYRLCFQALEARNQIQLALVHNKHMYAPASAHFQILQFQIVPLITNNSSWWCASVLVHTSAECMVLLLNRALMLLIICRVFMMK